MPGGQIKAGKCEVSPKVSPHPTDKPDSRYREKNAGGVELSTSDESRASPRPLDMAPGLMIQMLLSPSVPS